MSRVRKATSAVAALLLAGCPTSFQPGPACLVDRDCPAGQACFADGCGDPGQNLAVEVIPSPATGHHAQDFRLDSLGASQDLEIHAPSALQGQLQMGADAEPYIGQLRLIAQGESVVIPGVKRRYEALLKSQDGGYVFPLGFGVYSIGARTLDASVPPLREVQVEVGPASLSPAVDFELPDEADVALLHGRILRTLSPLLSVDAELTVQVLEPGTRRALSRASLAATTGQFEVPIERSAVEGESVLLEVRPLDPTALVPTVTFELTPDPADSYDVGLLAFGDFRAPIELTGQLFDEAGEPVVGAAVHVEGEVLSGGSFRSVGVLTDEAGRFALTTLPLTPGTSSLWAVPHLDDDSRMLHLERDLPHESAELEPFATLPRPELSGRLLKGQGAAAGGVRITARPIEPLGEHPLPAATFETETDFWGRFSLRLDPARYQLDLHPGGQLPRVTRIIDVEADVSLSTLELLEGRTVSGEVRLAPGTRGAGTALPYATIRFYRVVEGAGDGSSAPTSFVLATTLSEPDGSYSVVLPAGWAEESGY